MIQGYLIGCYTLWVGVTATLTLRNTFDTSWLDDLRPIKDERMEVGVHVVRGGVDPRGHHV